MRRGSEEKEMGGGMYRVKGDGWGQWVGTGGWMYQLYFVFELFPIFVRIGLQWVTVTSLYISTYPLPPPPFLLNT